MAILEQIGLTALTLGVISSAFVLTRYLLIGPRRILAPFVRSRGWTWIASPQSEIPEVRGWPDVGSVPLIGAWWRALGSGGIHIASGSWRDCHGEVGLVQAGEKTPGTTFIATIGQRQRIVPSATCEAFFRERPPEYRGAPADIERLFSVRANTAIAAFRRKIERIRIEGRTVSIWWEGTETDLSVIEAGLDLSEMFLRVMQSDGAHEGQ